MKSTRHFKILTAVLALALSYVGFRFAGHYSTRTGKVVQAERMPPLYPASAWSSHSHISGFAITTHGSSRKVGNLLNLHAWGSLVRYDIKNGKTMGAATIYAKPEVGFACISPDGQRIAFTKKDGTIAVIGARGGGETDLANLGSDFAYIQWPAGDGGEWIYYVGGFVGEGSKWLRRVSVKTHEIQVVAKFNREISSFGLSSDTTRDSGKFVTRVFDGRTVVYDLSEGTGNLYNRKEIEGCGVSAAPDGHYFIVTTFGHNFARVHSMDGSVKGHFGINQWAGAKHDDSSSWLNMRWSSNSPEWVAIPQEGSIAASMATRYKPAAPAGVHASISPASAGIPGGLNTVLCNWVKHEQIQVTDNPRDVADRAQGFWLEGSLPSQYELGYYAGKAPFTVNLTVAQTGGGWQWDYGDGSHEKAVRGQHTYRTAGIYTVQARQGRRTLSARVDVEERHPPVALTAQMLDCFHLWVTFSERVRLGRPRAFLEGGAAVKAIHLSPDGRSMTLQLQEGLKADTQLHLEGIYDLAQVPNTLKNPALPVKYLAWPSDRRGLLFVWHTSKSPNATFDPNTGEARFFQMVSHGAAGEDNSGALSFGGGYAEAVEADPALLRGCSQTKELSVEATIHPADLTQGSDAFPARIIDFAYNVMLVNFWIGQSNGRLKCALNGFGSDAEQAGGVDLCAIPKGVDMHVVVSCKPGRLVVFLNGKAIKEIDGVSGNFDSWHATRLKFAGERFWKSPWHGTLEGIAIYDRFLDADEVSQNCQISKTLSQSSKNPAALELQATLVDQSRAPTLSQIAPYHDALVMDEYHIQKVLRGVYTEGRIRVAHRAIMNDQSTSATTLQEGKSYLLRIDPLKAHPELEQQYISDTLRENYDLVPYTDAQIPAATGA